MWFTKKIGGRQATFGNRDIFIAVFIAGSIVTYLIAYLLFKRGKDLEAAAVIVASPFPCPSGLPC